MFIKWQRSTQERSSIADRRHLRSDARHPLFRSEAEATGAAFPQGLSRAWEAGGLGRAKAAAYAAPNLFGWRSIHSLIGFEFIEQYHKLRGINSHPPHPLLSLSLRQDIV